MYRHLSIAAACLLALSAAAEARPDTRTMTCNQVQQLLQSQGAAVLTTGTHTYDRYVPQFSDQCPIYQQPQSTIVTTSDKRSCRVYRCENIERLFESDR